MKTNFLIFVIISSMVILQYHSMNFWVEITNSWIGYVASVVVEVLALMFWYVKDKFLAPIASFIVIGASLIHLSSSSVYALNSIDNSNIKNNSIASVNKTLNRINDQNLSWWKTSKKAMDTMVILHSDINITNMPFTSSKTVAISSVMIEALMLLLVLSGQIKAIIFIRDEKEVTPIEYVDTNDKKSVTVNSNIVVDTSKAELAKRVLIALREFRTDKKLTSDRSVTRLLLLDTPDIDRLRQVVTTDKGMSIDKMNRILQAVKNYKEIV